MKGNAQLMSSVLISHASEDDQIVDRISSLLDSAGLDLWVDHKCGAIPDGDHWADKIEDALVGCRCGIFVLSFHSLKSRSCEGEWRRLLALGKKLYVARIAPVPSTEFPIPLNTIQWIDLVDSFDEGIARLTRTMRNDQGLAMSAAVQNTHSPVTRSNERELAEVTLPLDIRSFDQKMRDGFLLLFGTVTGAGVDHIKTVDVKEGSVVVTLDLPKGTAEQIVQQLKERPELFKDYPIKSIRSLSKDTAIENLKKTPRVSGLRHTRGKTATQKREAAGTDKQIHSGLTAIIAAMEDTVEKTANTQQHALMRILLPGEDLSQSVYDIAVVSLLPGPQSSHCVQWLLDHQNADGTWGASPQLCWYDSYICTYAAAVALRNAGRSEPATQAFHKVQAIGAIDIANTPETLTFGGLIDTLDRFCQANGWAVPVHNPTVQRIIHEEQVKWQTMLQWDGFYDPTRSIAGYSGERVYRDDRVDLTRFIRAFLTANGSISNSAGASAMVLIEAMRRQIDLTAAPLAALGTYCYSLDPYRQSIGYLDFAAHFVTAWAIMYLSELGHPADTLTIIQHKINEMYAHLHDGPALRLLCPVGLTTIPGDTDSTACAIWASLYAGKSIPDISRLDSMFVEKTGYYQTFLYERDPSISTNIHMAALLARYNPARLDAVLVWLSEQIAHSQELICKWHISPSYTVGELARVLAHIDHPKSPLLFLYAMAYLLETQHPDGGWGTGGSTIEETGYAVLGLSAVYDSLAREGTSNTGHRFLPSIDAALKQAYRFLEDTPITYPPLWIGKSLYCVTPLVPVLREVSKERIAQMIGRQAMRSKMYRIQKDGGHPDHSEDGLSPANSAKAAPALSYGSLRLHSNIGTLINRKTAALSIGIPFNGTRRWYQAVYGENRSSDYEQQVRTHMFAVLSMMFASGVKAIYSPVVGRDLESRGPAYIAMARQAVAHLAGDDILAWSKENQVHVALYGEMEGLSSLNAKLNTAISPDQAKAFLRLGCYAESPYVAYPRSYYGEAFYPLDIWVGMEQFTVFDVPGLLTGHTALYFLQFPTLYLNRRLWRRILLDWLLIRGNEEDPQALEPPSSSRRILGLGRRRAGRWSAR